jgi:hypothetical protein
MRAAFFQGNLNDKLYGIGAVASNTDVKYITEALTATAAKFDSSRRYCIVVNWTQVKAMQYRKEFVS